MSIDIIVEIPNISLVTSVWTRFGGRHTTLIQIGITVNVNFSQLTNMVLTLLALTIACFGVHCGLKYQHWPMKQTVVVDQKGCQWHTVPI